MQNLIYPKGNPPCTVAKFLKDLDFSLTHRRKIKRQAELYVNGSKVLSNDIINPGQTLSIVFPVSCSVLPQKGHLNIIFQDDYILVVDKPANMLVHPVGMELEGTLANYLCDYLQGNDFEGIHFVSRLDRDTSGLILVAKTAHVKYLFSKCKIRKFYLARLQGFPPAKLGIINLPIAKKNNSIIEHETSIHGKTAFTFYKNLSKSPDGSCLVQLEAITGRTHQLRVHMAALGCPITGDSLYGNKGSKTRHLLHACALSFCHPITNEMLLIKNKLPMDMQK